MACALTSSLSLGCRDAVGGLKRILVTELANKNSITQAAGAITAFTLTTGKRFWEYQLVKETSDLVEKYVSSTENGTLFYEQTLNIQLHKIQLTFSNELKLLAQNRLMIIIEDRNGNYWLMGEQNGAEVAPESEANFGKAMGDFNGYNFTFMAKEEQGLKSVASGLIAALTTPAS